MNETETLIHRYFETFNERDVEGRLALLSEDVRHDINEGKTEIGKAAFAEFIQSMDQRYVEKIEDLCVMSSGWRGAAEFIVQGRYVSTDEGLPEASGQRYTIPAAAFFDIRDGKIARVTSYYNLREWIAAVGG